MGVRRGCPKFFLKYRAWAQIIILAPQAGVLDFQLFGAALRAAAPRGKGLDNHGKDGGNVPFCDGHASWVQQAAYPQRWASGTDEEVCDVKWFPY
jgi:hypothetical protein